MKKIIPVILAIVLIAVSLCSLSVFAAAAPSFEVSSLSVKAGKDFDVTISLKNNPGIISAKLLVSFDSDITLKKAVLNEKLGGMTEVSPKLDSPVTLNWTNPTKELKSDMLYATISFTASKTASNGEHKIQVTYDADDVFNASEKNVTFKVNGGTVTVSGGTDKKAESAEASSDTKSEAASSEDILPAVDLPGEDTEVWSIPQATVQDDEVTVGETGGERNDGNGNYIGTEETLEFVDENGNPVPSDDAAGSKKAILIWVFSIIAVLIIAGGTAFVIYKKKADKKSAQ